MSRRLATAMAVAAAAAAGAQEVPTFGVRTEVVHVDVWVGRDDAPVAGLVAADFEVKDNGVAQQVELVEAGKVPLHAVLVLDRSASVAGERLEALKQAGRSFLAGLAPEDRATLVAFSHVSRLQGPVAGDPAAAAAALDGLTAGGATALHDAVFSGLALAGPSRGRPVVVVFSDGQDRVSWLSAEAVEAVARESEASVYAVDTTGYVESTRVGPLREEPQTQGPRVPANPWGIQSSTGRQTSHQGPLFRTRETPVFLRHVAEQTGGRVFSVGGPLEAAFLQVLAQLKGRHLLRYEPRGVAREGWHKLEVRLRGKKGDVRARPGYFVAAAEG